jgi:hypothetical protein
MIPFRSLHAREIDAREQHDQVRGADLDLRAAVARGRKAKGPDLEPLVPDRISVFFPDQELDPVGGLVSKDEEVPRKGIAAEGVANDRCQAIERLSQIGRLRTEPDAHRGRQAQHAEPPFSKTSSRRTRAARSKPGLTRRQRWLARTTSMASSSPLGTTASGTTRTGRNRGRVLSRRETSRRHQ